MDKFERLHDTMPQRETQEGRNLFPINENIINSYLDLRRSIGFMGIMLPILLFAHSQFLGHGCGLLPSISDYYFTPARTLFTGVIFIIAAFLWSNNVTQKSSTGESKTKKSLEKILSQIASIVALLVALFPTPVRKANEILQGIKYSKEHFEQYLIRSIQQPKIFGTIHYISAGIFFTLLLVIIIFIYIPFEKNTNYSSKRISGYWICASLIFCSMIFIIVTKLFFANENCFTFFGESVALISFGAAWLVKGNTIEKNYTIKEDFK